MARGAISACGIPGQAGCVWGGDFWPPCRPGFLDLYSGEKGVALAASRHSGVWTLCFDIKDGPEQDLEDPQLRRKLEWLIKAGAFLAVGAAPVCSSFSQAITPPVRAWQFAFGKPDVSPTMQAKIDSGNDHARWLLMLLFDLHIPFWVENPASSWLFRLPDWAKWVQESGVKSWIVDYCRFHMAWRKRTRFLTTLRLAGFSTLCFRDHQHFPLRGRSHVHRKSWTLVAQPYPKGVAEAVGRCMAAAIGKF